MGSNKRYRSRLCLRLIICLLGCWCGASAAHAQGANGALRGSIQDADFFAPLAGVNVVLEGGAAGATTDSDGNFFINNVPPGSYTVLAARDGYVRARLSEVVINAGGVKEISLEMTGEVVELDEFVVNDEAITNETATVEAITLRTELKSFSEVLGQQFISQTGASDVAKLLAKTTGVNVAEGKFVVVRGLADRYNSVTLNGLRVPSSDPDRRAVALDLFPTAVIRDVRTSKTFLPNLPGESTGATIDVKTKSVPQEDFVKVKIGSGYNTQATGNRGFLSYNGGGTGMFGNSRDRAMPDFLRNTTLADMPSNLPVGTRALRQRINETLSPEMGTKEKEAPMDFTLEASMGHRTEFMGLPAGFTIAVDYSKKYTYSDRDSLGRYTFINDPNLPEVGQVESVRRLAMPAADLVSFIEAGTAPGAALPSDNLPLGIRNGQETMRAGMLVSAGVELDADSELTFTYFFNRVAEDRATLQIGYDAANPDSGSLRESLVYTEREIRSYQVAGSHGIKDTGPDLQVDWALSYNNSYQYEPDQRFSILNYDLPLGSGGFSFPIQDQEFFQRIWRELNDENYNFRLDIVSDIFGDLPDDMEAKIKFGGLLDYSDRVYRADTFAYLAQGNNVFFTSEITPNTQNPVTLGDVLLVNIPNLNTNPSGAPYLFRQNDPETYEASQMISAGYFMFDVDLTPSINLVFGARVETTDLHTQASPIWIYPDRDLRVALLSTTQQSDGALVALLETAASPTASAARTAARADSRLIARSRGNISATSVLPALSATWEIAEDQRIRAAISQTIARPSFKEISPVVFANAETGDFFVGNIDLKMSSIVNYDTRWEWFPEPGALVGISTFAKTITNPIEYSQDGVFTRYINVDKAVVYGLELEFQRDFSFITPELKPFSLGANYSYIKSIATRTNLGGPAIFGTTRRLQGQPDYIFNFNLTYDSTDVPWSGGAFLNVTGQQLFAVSSRFNEPDVFQEPYTTLDLGLAYKFSKKCKLSFRASNVTNAEVRRVYNNSQQPVFSVRRPGVGYSFSITFDW
jgi:TonB-dependent receptor